MRTLGLLVIGAALLLAAGGRADANGVGISDALTVFSPTGTVFAQVAVSESAEVAGQVYFIDIDGLADPQMADSPTELLEPDSGLVSDIFGVRLGVAESFYYLYFQSDSEGPSLGDNIGSVNQLTEVPGMVYNATRYLAPGFRDAGYTATFVSDADVDPVPEPVTVASMVLGLGVLVRYVRRR